MSRPINIEFDQYTEGDSEFKKELILLITNDIRELQQSIAQSTAANDAVLFFKACHRSKTSIEMLKDQELNQLLEDLKLTVQGRGQNGASLSSKIKHLNTIVDELVNSLAALK